MYTRSMQWPANPNLKREGFYSLTKLSRLNQTYAFRKTKSLYLHSIYVRYDAPRF